MGQGLVWAPYKGQLLEQGWNKRIKELEIQAAHTRSLWKSKWERTKHQLTQRLHNYLRSLQSVRNRIYVGRQRSCLRLGVVSSSQILSWMGNLHVAWSCNIFYVLELPRLRACSPDLWQYPKAPFSTADDDLVPYLEATNKTPDLTYLRKLKKGNTLGIGPSLLGPGRAKVSLQAPR